MFAKPIVRPTLIQQIICSAVLQLLIIIGLLYCAFRGFSELEQRINSVSQHTLPLATSANDSERQLLLLAEQLRQTVNSANSEQFQQQLTSLKARQQQAQEARQQLKDLANDAELVNRIEQLEQQIDHAEALMAQLLQLVEQRLTLAASIDDGLGYLLYSIGATRDEMNRLIPLLFADIPTAQMAYDSFIADANSVMTAQMYLMSSSDQADAERHYQDLQSLISRMAFQYQALIRDNPELANYPSLSMALAQLESALTASGLFSQQHQQVQLSAAIAQQQQQLLPRLAASSELVAQIVNHSKQQMALSQQQAQRLLSANTQQLISQTLFGLVLIGITLVGLTRRLNGALQALKQGIKAIANGDFSQPISVASPAEFNQLANWLNQASQANRKLLQGLRQGGQALHSASQTGSQISDQQRQELSNQSLQTSQIAAAVQQLDDSMQAIDNDCSNTVKQSQHSAQLVAQGQQALLMTSKHFEQLTTHLATNHACMNELDQQMNQIGAVAEVINAIAERTNLLALNAAIEAARAGEQGRGFAVVADEVRKLAAQTRQQTESIETMLNALHQAVDKARSSAQASRQEMSNTNQLRQQLVDASQQINNAITNMGQRALGIAAATQQQSQQCHQISQSINTLADQSAQRHRQLEQLSQHANQVAAIANEQQQKLSHYRL